MTKIKDVFDFLDTIAPFNSAMDFDNVGLLVGCQKDPVLKCLVALDITKSVINEAKHIQADLIISHHPVIFTPMSKLKADSVPYILAQNKISAICAHTNLDLAPDFGVNACLAKELQLSQVFKIDPIGVIGTLPQEMATQDLAQFVKEKLHVSGVRFNKVNKNANRVIVCGGSGGDLVSVATKLSADALITGEIKHHEILFATENNLIVIDAGHFATENVVVAPLVDILSKKFKNVQFFKSTACINPMQNL